MSYLKTRERVDRPLHSVQTKNGFYSETQITNHTGEPLYLVDKSHNKVLVRSEVDFCLDRHPRVEILSRYLIGPKKFKEYPRIEDWHGDLEKLTISMSALQKRAIYVPEIDLVICLERYLGEAIHPQNVAVRMQCLKKLERELAEQLGNSPCIVVANDPTDKVERLWMDMNGFLCEISVSNNKNEPSHFTIGIRDSGSHSGYRYIELNMSDILEGKIEHTCDDKPIFVGMHKSHVAEAIRKKSLINEGKFDESILNDRIKEVDAKYRTQLAALKEDNARLIRDKEILTKDKDRIIDQLTNQLREYQDIIAVRHSQEKMELEKQRLQAEKDMLHQKEESEQRKSIHETKLAEMKVAKEDFGYRSAQASNVASGLKAATVILPIVAVGAAAVAGWVSAPASIVAGVFSLI